MHENLVSIILMLIIACGVSLLLMRVKMPYSTALVVAGLAIGYFKLIPGVKLDPEVVMYLFLPILLFEGAISTNLTRLKENFWPIFVLSVPGVAVSILIIGTLIHFLLNLPWVLSFLLGSIIAPTDTISILSILKTLKIPPRLGTIMEGENLFNDGVALVLFRTILAIVFTHEINYVQIGFGLAFSIVGGLMIGFGMGYIASIILKPVKDNMVEIMITAVLAVSSYLVAESFHVGPLYASGVIAVVAAGLMIGSYGWKNALSPSTQIALGSFWQFAGFLVNSLVFLMVGLAADIHSILSSPSTLSMIFMVFLAMLAGRILTIYPSFWITNLFGKVHVPAKWQHIFVWGNIKGSLSLALAIGLPLNTPQRDLLISLVLGVVLSSLILQGLTLRYFIRWLRVNILPTSQFEYEQKTGQILVSRHVQEELTRIHEDGLISRQVYNHLRSRYQIVATRAEKELKKLQEELPSLEEEEFLLVEERMVKLEKNIITNALREGVLSYEAAKELLDRADGRLVRLMARRAMKEQKSFVRVKG